MCRAEIEATSLILQTADYTVCVNINLFHEMFKLHAIKMLIYTFCHANIIGRRLLDYSCFHSYAMLISVVARPWVVSCKLLSSNNKKICKAYSIFSCRINNFIIFSSRNYYLPNYLVTNYSHNMCLWLLYPWQSGLSKVINARDLSMQTIVM